MEDKDKTREQIINHFMELSNGHETTSGKITVSSLAYFRIISIQKFFGIILLTFFMLMPRSLLSYAQDTQTKKVLILHSYHRGLTWNDAIDRGIESIFENIGYRLNTQTEYLDTKRLSDSTFVNRMREICRLKFGNQRFDVVICSDNNALDFLINYHNEFFSKTPLVICGINSFQKSMVSKDPLLTGTVESTVIRETLDIALKLHPKTRHVFVYGSDTTTYFANKESLKKAITDYEKSIDFSFVENLNIRQIQNDIWKLPNSSIVLILCSIRDGQDQLLPFQRFPEMMAGVSNVPIYGNWDFLLGHGIVGGKLVGGFAQGQMAARAAFRILKGDKIEKIPLLRAGLSQYMFDYRQMQRFGIKLFQLPKYAIVLNRPLSFYSKNKTLIWGVAAGIFLLSLVVVVLSINILNRKKAEKALRESEKRFRSLAENAPFGISIMKPDRRFDYLNPKFTDTFGYTIEDIPNKETWFEKAYPDEEYRKEVLSAWKRDSDENLKTGKTKSRVFSVKSKDGLDKTIHFRIVSLKDNKQFLTYEDITNRVRAEEEKKSLESQLQQSQKMEAIATLAGGIAHQFNNAISAITGNIELLRMDLSDDENITQYVDPMEDSAYLMANLTSQLLAYAKGGKYNPVIVSLSDFVEDTLPLIRHIINPAISIETDLTHDVLYTEADYTQMQMVLSALLANADEAIEGTGRIRITTKNKEIDDNFTGQHRGLKPGHYVSLAVEDDGKGMDEETKNRIFEPFFTTKFQGRGLGMAAVYGVVKNHNGWVYVESELGKGTTAHIYIPVVETMERDIKPPRTGLEKGINTVLVIEDECFVMNVTRAILEKLGYDVLEGKTGKEALDLAKSFDGEIDLAILDTILPDMTGKEIFLVLKDIHPDIKVIVCSGYEIDGPAQQILDAGAQGFIQKPYSLETLSKKVKAVLEE